jgi:S1-C subfamily serine protease
VERVRPAVVSVVSQVLTRDVFGRVFRDSQSGSGVIFDSRGYILTNNHVVENASTVTVTLDDGRQFQAKVAGADDLTDLAVLKIDGRQFPQVPLGDPSRVRVGDWVIAIGNALAFPGGPTVTVGVVSALDRAFQVRADLQLYGLIQTDASINPGNSGGPLVGLEGEVVGINTAVARGDQAGREIEGIGFAVGMETAVPVAQQLMEKGKVQWAWMGVFLDDLDPQKAAEVGVSIREGVLITELLRGGPAWDGGIRAGDVIVSMAGRKVSTVRDLIRLLRLDVHPGNQVEVMIFREKKELTLKVTMGERPAQ